MAPSKSKNQKPSKTLHNISKKQFKSKPKGKKNNFDDAVLSQEQSSVAALQLEDDVPDFPRGGGSILSRQEREEVRAEADAEFESEERFLKKNKKSKGSQKRSQTAEDEFGSLFGDAFTGKLPKFANKITLKNISPGMKLWGVVAEVNDKDIVVSLPGGLRGLVLASEAFDPLTHNEINGEVESNFLSSVYHVGQLVSCIVLQLDDDKKEKGKRRIWLSLRLSLLHKSFTFDVIQEGIVLSAYVKSIEDHGYTLHFGLPSFSGFLPKGNQSESGDVKVGQLIQGLVKSIDKSRRLLYMSSDSDIVSKCVTKDLKGISIDLLVPGMMVDARIRSTLENGIMLSFLAYFTGTVDIFNLHEAFPTSSWKEVYTQNKKVNARILFIDPTTRAVGLTLNSHLVRNRAPPILVKTGDILDKSKVIRVDRGLGLLLEIPSTPVPTPAYVNVSDVADKEVKKLEKTFKEGSYVRLRVLGFRHLEGLATGTLKTSALEGSVFTHSDVKPGMVVKAKIVAVDAFGAIVQFGSGVKALCPLRHMSEFEITKPRKKFQVGAELIFRVLGCKSKRITVTQKKTLVKSKLEILSSYADAVEGLLTHGWITKIENHGCFVRFYNGVQGFAPRYELGLDAGSDISSMYHVEQVVKCRVTSSNPTARRINLSFTTKPRVLVDSAVNIGGLVSGAVERVTPHAVVIKLNAKGDIKGTISPEHLADHQGHASLLKSLLKPGYEFDQLLVLDIEGCNPVLTAKYSLVYSAQQLPLDITQVRPHSVVHGYVCNLIETGCFIRFIGHLTGFAPKSKAVDDRQCNLSEVFYIGQSVRSNIVDVNSETSRITLSLKQSLCSSTDASFIQQYFILEDKIARLQLLDSQVGKLDWANEFDLGGIIEGEVTETKDFGVVIGFRKFKDIFGFISHYQLGGISVESGTAVQAMVVDVSRLDRLVDLSLKPEFVHRSKQEASDTQDPKKKRKRSTYKELEVNQTVNAQVEIIKEDYLVLSLPEYNFALGYASVIDYNTQKAPRKQFFNGQSVTAIVAALPSPSTSGRLLLLLKSISDNLDSSSSKRAKKKFTYNIGSLVEAEIIEIKGFELRVKFGSGFQGRIHVTEAADDNLTEDPFSRHRVGQKQIARIVSKINKKRGYQWELSMKPSLLAGSGEVEDGHLTEGFNYSIGEHVSGFVYKVDKEWAWLTVSRDVNARFYILDSACEPTELAEFQKRYYAGKVLSGYILQAEKEKKLLRLVLDPLVGDTTKDLSMENGGPTGPSNEITSCHIREGCAVGGRISKILPGVGGVLVQIDQHSYGKVHFTELAEPGASNPLSGYQEGDFVKCEVLEISQSAVGTVHFDLSLRPTSNSMQHRVNSCIQRLEKIEDLHPDMVIQGYVKNVSPRGCFIMISRKLDAKILLSNLADGYIENPEKEFPLGKLVTGKVLSLDPLSKRVEVTLRTSSAVKRTQSDINALDSLVIGDVITGRIKRVERYGLFVIIDNTNVVGLCHVSELSDEHVDNIETIYKAGERVTVKVLKVDKEKNRVSLGMKNSYFSSDLDVQETSEIGSDNAIDEDHGFADKATALPVIENVYMQTENGKHPILAELESRAFIPPLHVPLDEIEIADVDNFANQDLGHSSAADNADGTSKKHVKKKMKEEREREIRAAEERLLEKDIPRNADEFEKLVRSSPNSSFLWIKYMAFMLSLADVEKARSIAERALRTINIREESEKLNIWVAYFNLENEYGNPPEEAVKQLFHRALQYSDPKKVHLALLGVYERTEQHKLVNELLEKMIKKFKHSCKVWLRRIQSLLKQNSDGMQLVVNRALLCLPRHKHIKFISHTAILEFKCGVPDRGRSLFEGMLREYPKRTDLWSIYLDQEIRLGEEDLIRALFERAISLSLPPKKMKFLFKKYLEYEKSVGDEERIESVKRKAIEYVESSLA